MGVPEFYQAYVERNSGDEHGPMHGAAKHAEAHDAGYEAQEERGAVAHLLHDRPHERALDDHRAHADDEEP